MISIVTISMNQGGYLPIAVRSVLSQRDVEIEYVVVDAGSTDGSREYLSTLDDPRVTLVLEPDGGPADGLNKGVAATRGTIIGYLNADDLYLASALSEVEDLFRRRPSIDVAYGDGWIIDGENRVIRHFESSPWGLRRYLHGGVSVLQQSTFFRRGAFDRTAGFNPGNTTCWDGELLVDMALTGAMLQHVRSDWSAFRLHSAGISGSGRLEARYRQDRQRYVERAMGRNRRSADRVTELAARCAKLLGSPGYAARRLRSGSAAGTRCEYGSHGYVISSDPATP